MLGNEFEKVQSGYIRRDHVIVIFLGVFMGMLLSYYVPIFNMGDRADECREVYHQCLKEIDHGDIRN